MRHNSLIMQYRATKGGVRTPTIFDIIASDYDKALIMHGKESMSTVLLRALRAAYKYMCSRQKNFY